MRYWWVNQNQTYAHEVHGNYLWSPKVNANGHRNPFYESMREVAPGDVVFSFCDTYIKAIGIARSHAYEAPKPIEFQNAGAYWNKVGWRVDVGFIELKLKPRPADNMGLLREKLPKKYSPLQESGRGLQGVYLTEVTRDFAEALLSLMDQGARNLVRASFQQDAAGIRADAVGLAEWEAHQMAEVQKDEKIPETDRMAVVLARRGQGKFKENVLKRESRCRITLVDRIEHLRASHCKPWRDASNNERLDGENGLLLTPTMDHLFDRGFISFKDNGEVLVSPVAHKESLAKMGLPTDVKVNVGSFTSMQRKYLDFHRNYVFLESRNRV